MRFFKLDNKNWPCGVSDGLVLPCAVCGEEDIKFDYVVTDKLWDMIVPKEIRRDVVCLPCLDKLAKEKHADLGSNMESLQFTGINMTIEFLPCNIFYYNKENKMKEHFEKQLKNSNPITEENLKELLGKSLYSDYQVGDKMLCFIEQKIVDAENINMTMMTVVPRELDLLAGDFKFDKMADLFPVLIRKEK